MFSVGKRKIGDDVFDMCIIEEGGFADDGYVRMEMRVADGKSEGNELFIGVMDSEVAKRGDYSPFAINSRELGYILEYLISAKEAIDSREPNNEQ